MQAYEFSTNGQSKKPYIFIFYTNELSLNRLNLFFFHANGRCLFCPHRIVRRWVHRKEISPCFAKIIILHGYEFPIMYKIRTTRYRVPIDVLTFDVNGGGSLLSWPRDDTIHHHVRKINKIPQNRCIINNEKKKLSYAPRYRGI